MATSPPADPTSSAFPAAMRAAFEQRYPQIPWIARNSRDDWRILSENFEHAWFAAVHAERERCCGIVFGQCESDNVAQRTVDAIRGVQRRTRGCQQCGIEGLHACPGQPIQPLPLTDRARLGSVVGLAFGLGEATTPESGKTPDVLRTVPAEDHKADIPGIGKAGKHFWVLELRPAFEPHPAFPPTFYMPPANIGFRRIQETRDLEVARRWPNRAAAERAAENTLGTLSCVWEVAEFVHTPNGPVRATDSPAT